MNKTLQLLGILTAGSFMASTPAWGQPVYTTPYTFTTIAGTAGTSGFGTGLNGAGQFGFPEGIAVGTNDNLYVADSFYNIIRKVIPATGTNWSVSTIAGTGNTSGGGDGTNTNARFNEPTAIAIDGSNNLYVADSFNNTIRELTLSGQNWVVVTIAGTAGTFGSADGTNGAALFGDPSGIAVDATGNLYVADTDNQVIRRIVPVGTNWVVTTIAGSVNNSGPADGTNLNAQFFLPVSITIDRSNNLYVADSANDTIREITPVGTNWVVSTIAGIAGVAGTFDGTNTDSLFQTPSAITVDANGNLYVADTFNNTIRQITPVGTNWVTTTLAGDPNNSGTNNGTGSTALFNNPYGVAVDIAGNLFVSDTENSTIRKGFVAAVPNPTIALTAGNTVTISWPGPGGTLQTNSDLTTVNWATYGGAISSNNGTNSVTLTPTGVNLFFRLTR